MRQQEKTEMNRLFSQRIRDIRMRREMSLEQFGKLLGFSASRVGNWEQGLNCTTPANLNRISRILGCSVEYLLGETTELGTPPPLHDAPPGGLDGGPLREAASEAIGRQCIEHVTVFVRERNGDPIALGWTLTELRRRFPLREHAATWVVDQEDEVLELVHRSVTGQPSAPHLKGSPSGATYPPLPRAGRSSKKP